MKKIYFSTLFAVLFGMVLFSSCSSDSDSSDQYAYNNVSVTVTGDDFTGYRLYTDFDVILNPTNISQLPQLKEVSRALITFSLADQSQEIADLEAGKTYDILLDVTACHEIPTFTYNIDTSSQEYLTNGQDSIALKNQKVQSLSQSSNLFYVKNGYMNTVATFGYASSTPVRFSLYYEGTEDVDAAGKSLTLHLYYNSGTSNPEGTTTVPLSFRISSEIYALYKDAGIADDESIDVYLKASTLEYGSQQLHYQIELSDLLLP